MARALFEGVVQETDGDIPAAGTPVLLLEEDGTTPLSTPIYAASSGGSPLGTTTLTTDALGRVQAYSNTAKRIKTKVGTQTPVLNAFWPDPANILTIDGELNLEGATLTDAQIEDVVIAGLVKRRETGPMIFDLEAFVTDPDAFNTDGTLENDYNTSPAWDLLHTAYMASTTGPTSGGTHLGGRVIRCGSPVITAEQTINWTKYTSSTIVSTAPGAITRIYSGNGFTGPAAGTPAYVQWVADGLTEAQRAGRSPMADSVGMSNCLVWGFEFCAQVLLNGTSAPTNRPAVGLLVGATETYNTTVPGDWNAAGGNSNNNTYRQVSGIGWTKYADLAFVNSVLMTLDACGGQSYGNESASMSLYMGKTTLDTNGNPDPAGTAFDSVWFPHDPTPATNSERLCRNEVSNGDHVIIRTEWHDMVPIASGANPAVKSAKQRTMLIHEVTGLEIIDCPISSSGIAQIDLWGQCQNVSLSNAQNYNKGTLSARSNFFIRSMAVNISNPHKGITIRQLQGSTAPLVGWIGCGGASADDSPAFVQLNAYDNILATTDGFGTDVPFIYSLSSYSGAATEVNLAYSDIDLNGCGYQVGGSIGPTVTFRNVPLSGEQVSGGGGFNRARRYYIDGTVRMYGPLTVDTGNITATAGDLAGRHFIANGSNIVTGDIALGGDWGSGGGGAVKSAIVGKDGAFQFRVTSGTGALSANPTATITFKSAFTNAPIVLANIEVASGASVVPKKSVSTTTIVLTFLGTVTDSTTYDFTVHAMGFV